MKKNKRLLNLNRVHVHKDGIRKFIKKHQLESYLSSGWEVGTGKQKNKESDGVTDKLPGKN
jgi:hypothetical protein